MIAAIIVASKSDGQASRHTLWDMLVDSRFSGLPSSITTGTLDCLGVKNQKGRHDRRDHLTQS